MSKETKNTEEQGVETKNTEVKNKKFSLKDFFGGKNNASNKKGKNKEDVLNELGLNDGEIDEKKLLKNKDLLLSLVDGQTINYTDFLKQSEKIKMGKKRILKMLEEVKKDFDDKKEQIEFKISGSKEVRFGRELNSNETYTIINNVNFEDDIVEYFTKQMKLKTKDQEIKDSFSKLIEEKAKLVVKEKSAKFNIGTATIEMNIVPVSNIFTLEIKTLGINKNVKIDLSK